MMTNESEYEEHLYSCDHCMDLYMEAIELVQDDLPSIEGPSLYTDEVMERIPFEGGSCEYTVPEAIGMRRKCFIMYWQRP